MDNVEVVKAFISKEFGFKALETSLLCNALTTQSPDSLVVFTALSSQIEDFHGVLYDNFDNDNSDIVFFDSDSNSYLAFQSPAHEGINVLYKNSSIQEIIDQIAKQTQGKAYLISQQGAFIANSDSTDRRKTIGHIGAYAYDLDEVFFQEVVTDQQYIRFICKVEVTEKAALYLVMTVPKTVFLDDFKNFQRIIVSLTAIAVLLIITFTIYVSLKFSKKESEEKIVKNQLELSNAQLLSFIENPGEVSIFSLDRELRYTGFNKLHHREMKEVFDADVNKGDQILNFLPAEIAERLEQHFQRALQGEHFTVTGLFEEKYFSQIYNPVFANEGFKSEVIGLTGNVFEVTDKIKAEQELEKYRHQLEDLVKERTQDLVRQKDFFQQIIDRIPTLVFVRNKNGQYLMVNKAVADSLGHDTSELVGKSVKETHNNATESDIFIEQDLNIIETDGFIEEENFQNDVQGTPRWYYLTKKRIELNGEYVVLGVQHDITYLKNTEEKLKKANFELKDTLKKLESTQLRLLESEKMASIGQLTAGLAHEINNPMNYVSGNINPIKKDLQEIKSFIKEHNLVQTSHIKETFDELDALIDAVAEGTDRVKVLMANLSAFSIKNDVKKTLTHLLEPIESTINLVEHSIRERINFTLKFPDNLPLVNLNVISLKQVLLNVINNSIHAITDKGEIEIALTFNSNELLITITDDGIGIKPEHLPDVFNPFFSTKDVGEGTGLGLSISYKIMSDHNGRIEIDSSYGVGTTVILKFPL